MSEDQTTAAVQRYLDALAGDAPADPIIRRCSDRAVGRLEMLCANMLFRSYPRLTRPPLNLQTDELLGAVVERLLKAMRAVRPRTVREFFALANQHMRWELNDLARRLDEQPCRRRAPRGAGAVAGQQRLGAHARTPAASWRRSTRLPADEREAFSLVRIQGLTQGEAAEVLGVSVKTVQRRLNRARVDAWRSGWTTSGRPGGRGARCRPGRAESCRRLVSAWDRGRSVEAQRWPAKRDVRELLEAILDSDLSPEEVCQGDPELLTGVRERLRHLRQVEAQLDALFPRPRPRAPARRPSARGPPNRLTQPVTRCRTSWAEAAWASSTGRGIVASTAPSPSRCSWPAPLPARRNASDSGGRPRPKQV